MIKVAFMVSALLCSADNWFVLYLMACFIFAVGYVGFFYLFIYSLNCFQVWHIFKTRLWTLLWYKVYFCCGSLKKIISSICTQAPIVARCHVVSGSLPWGREKKPHTHTYTHKLYLNSDDDDKWSSCSTTVVWFLCNNDDINNNNNSPYVGL